MSQKHLKRLPRDPKLNRLVLAHVDLEAALRFADTLLANKRRTDRDRGLIREALTVSMIVAYCRPFKNSHGDGGRTARYLTLQDIGPFSEHQIGIHNRLIGWRDQIVAHSDPGPRQLRYEYSPFFGQVPTMRDTTIRLSDDGARSLRNHIDYVLSFVALRLAGAGIRGFGLESGVGSA